MFRLPKLFDVLVFAGCVAMLSFFHWHATKGPRSLDNHAVQVAKLEARKTDLAKVRAKRDAIEARVKLMRPESVDPDMASQLVREKLGYGKVNSIVVKLPR
ncbi:MAG: septum formation initiator family protein [Pseudomonadota bacterium]